VKKKSQKVPLSRSEMMSRVKGRDTGPELVIRSFLHGLGYRFRVSYKTPGGKVDIAFPKIQVAIQIDGCFWHACPRHGTEPKTNVRFWRTKLRKNRERDERQKTDLRASGWKLIRYWEHQVENAPGKVVDSIESILRKTRSLNKGRR
jgi:DNA mismatch endonuclease, patch repair protein